MPRRKTQGTSKKWYWIGGAIAAVLLVMVLFKDSIPVHWLMWGLATNFIWMWVLAIFAGIAIFMGYKAVQIYNQEHPFVSYNYDRQVQTTKRPLLLWTGVVLVFLVFLLGFLPWLINTYGTSLATSYEPETLTMDMLGTTTNPKFAAFDVAVEAAKGQQGNSQKVVGDLDTIFTGGSSLWVGGRQPNGFFNQIRAHTDAIVMVDDQGQSSYEPVNFACAENGIWNANVYWKLAQTHYWGHYEEVSYWKTPQGQWYIMTPVIGQRLVFPAQIPVWDGVILLDQNCKGEYLTPTQAEKDPRLVGAPKYPSDLALESALKWGFRFGGLVNELFVHKNQVEVNDIPGANNQQPYQIDTNLGHVWVVAAEPSGSSSHAVSMAFLFSTNGDKVWRIQFDQNQPLVGPADGAGYAKSRTSGYVWDDGEGNTSKYVMIEPRPLTKQNQWFWMYTITTSGHKGTAAVTVVNALKTSEVYHFCSRTSLINWLNGVGDSDNLPCDTQPATGSESTSTTTTGGTSQTPSDLSKLTDQELWQLINAAQQELQSRHR